MTVFHRFWDNIFPIFFHAVVLILLFPWPCSHKLSTVAAAACQKKQLLRMTLLFPDLPASPSYPLVILFGTITHIQRLTAKQFAVPDNDLVNSDSLISREKLLGGWAGSDENHVITTVEITCCIREDTARRRCLSGNPRWFFSWLATRKSFPFPFSLLSLFFFLSSFIFLCSKTTCTIRMSVCHQPQTALTNLCAFDHDSTSFVQHCVPLEQTRELNPLTALLQYHKNIKTNLRCVWLGWS